jgi:GTP-binding protein
MRAEFDQFTTEYFKQRKSLAMVFLLVDSSIPPQKVDLEYAQRLADFGTPFCIVFTKADKRKKGAPPNRKNRIAFKHELLKTFELLPPSVVTSAESGMGKSQLQALIASLRVAYEKSH